MLSLFTFILALFFVFFARLTAGFDLVKFPDRVCGVVKQCRGETNKKCLPDKECARFFCNTKKIYMRRRMDVAFTFGIVYLPTTKNQQHNKHMKV